MNKVPLVKNFRKNLRRACDDKGITQQELSKRSGVHYVSVCRILSGQNKNPGVNICERLAAAAGVRPDTIFLEPLQTPVDAS